MEPVRRYKKNDTRWAHMDGFTGSLKLNGVSPALMPWLMAGQILQIGKAVTLGFGEYHMTEVTG